MKIAGHDLDRDIMVIAEIGNNHEGSLSLAEEMIGRAAEAGAHAVKFQTIVPERLVAPTETARLEQLRRFQFSMAQFEHLAGVAAGCGVLFLSTPFDVPSVAALDPLVPAFKIASGDNDCVPLLRAVAATGKPVLLSCGLADMAEIERNLAVIEDAWAAGSRRAEVALLHCVVSYPVPPAEAHLAALASLRSLGHTIGYSDHTVGVDAAVLAVALGARIVEKHFTLDKTRTTFRDHQLSADPADLADLVRRAREALTLVGEGPKRIRDCEAASGAARRGLYASRALAAGARVAADDLICLRPAAGIPARLVDTVVGRHLARSVPAGQPITSDDLA